MYIKSLSIENLRCFRDASLDLRYPDSTTDLQYPNINLIVGINGAGKTTVLKAVALNILSSVIHNSGFTPYHLVRRTNVEAPKIAQIQTDLLLHAQDINSRTKGKTIVEHITMKVKRIRDTELLEPETGVSPHWENIFDDKSPAFLLVGYGVNRRVESASTYDSSTRARTRQLRYQRVAGLFEEQMTLTPLSTWLPQLEKSNRQVYKEIVRLLHELLPKECRLQEMVKGGEYMFNIAGASVPFGALSDGYRAYIGWITDLLYHLWLGASRSLTLRNSKGIVLIDEIDLHIHPQWQRSIVPKISRTLPNLQFILTTHSPIVTGTVESGNIFVTESDATSTSKISQIEERVHGLSAEQVLLSSYFDLDTTRAPVAEDELTNLARLAQKGDRTASMTYLRKLTEGFEEEDRSKSI